MEKNINNMESLTKTTSSTDSTSSSSSDVYFDDGFDCSDENFNAVTEKVTEKVHQLEDQLSAMTKQQKSSQERNLKLTKVNKMLVERVRVLEEQLAEFEQTSSEMLKIEQKKHQAALNKALNEKSEAIEEMAENHKKEQLFLQDQVNQLKAKTEELREENQSLESHLNYSQNRLSELERELDEIEEHHKVEQRLIKEKAAENSSAFEELLREVEDLRMYKAGQEAKEHSGNVSNIERKQYENQTQQLKQEKQDLQVHINDLETALVSKCELERSTLETSSLQAEFQNSPEADTAEELKQCKEDNKRLLARFNDLTMMVLAHNPSLLEKPYCLK